jgi:hypothetical protein
MTHRPSMPAVEYRQLWSRLVEMRKLDPENDELQALQREFVQIGIAADVAANTHAGGEETADTALRTDMDWDRAEIELSAEDSEIVDRVAEITNVPE